MALRGDLRVKGDMTHTLPAYFLIAAMALLAACTPRADIAPVPAPEGVGTDVEVLVGTTRKRLPGGLYDPTGRSSTMTYATFDVVIPEEHITGEVEVGGKNRNPQQHFITRAAYPLADGAQFRRVVAHRLRDNPQYNGEVFIFVHGFNNTMGDGVYRTAQMASDMTLQALPVHYSWPSSGAPLGYPHDRDSALFARRGLQTLIEELTAAGARNIILAPHSMGSHVVMETLRQMSLSGRGAAWDRIGGVAMMAPDIDIDVFHAQAADIGALPQPFVLFTSSRDRALKLSARLTGQKARLGNIPSVEQVASLDVTVLDVSKFNDTSNAHLTVVSSPTFIRMVEESPQMGEAFQQNSAAMIGLLPGTVLTVQNATAVLLDPVDALLQVEN